MKYFKDKSTVYKVEEYTEKYWAYDRWDCKWVKSMYPWGYGMFMNEYAEISEQEAFIEIL